MNNLGIEANKKLLTLDINKERPRNQAEMWKEKQK